MRDKREKFIELANKRVVSAIDKMRLIGNLSDNRYYQYSDADVKKIIDALTKELNSVRAKFQHNKNQKEKEFRLEV